LVSGVAEPLNETTIGIDHMTGEREGVGITARGTHYIMLSEPSAALEEVRSLMDEVFLPGR